MGSSITIYGKIEYLDCNMNGITELDLSATPLLKELNCEKRLRPQSPRPAREYKARKAKV